MYNNCVASTITIRTRGTLPFPFNEYAHCSLERSHLNPLSSRNCCSCCADSSFRLPINPSYCYNLYGFRQSSLIHWSPCRKARLGGLDPCYYSRVPVCFVDRSCHCDKIYNFNGESVGRRREGSRKCKVFEEKSERLDFGCVDEAEALLSLLTEDVGEECFKVRKEDKRIVRKPIVEKRQESEFCNECGSEKKRVDSGASECKTRFEYEAVLLRKNGGGSREKRSRKEEQREALLKREDRKARILDVKRGALSIKDVTDAEEVDNRVSSRRKSEEQHRIESKTRKENRTAEAGVEENEEFFRRDEHRQRVRKDGSSCSSYYSLSSNGDYESDVDVEIGEGRYSGNSSNAYKRDSRSDELVYQEKNKRVHDRRDDHIVSHAHSSVVESDFRKKSEKKLTDVSIEGTEFKKESFQKESETSMLQESGVVKHDSFVKYDDSKVKSTGSSEHDVDRKHVHRQRENQISRQIETRMKHKQFVEASDDHNVDIRTSYGSQKVYTGMDKMSLKATSSRQEAAAERQTAIRQHSTAENIYQRDSLKVAETSETQDVDLRKISSSQQKFETRVKAEEENTANIRISAYDTEKHHYDQVSKLEEFRRKSQQLTQEKITSTLKKKSQIELISQEENVNVAYVSSSGSKEQSSQSHSEVSRREDLRSGSDMSTNISITQSIHGGVVVLGEHNKTSSQVESADGLTAEEVVGERLRLGSAASNRGRLKRSTALHHHEAHGELESDGGKLSEFTSHGGAIESAAQSLKSAEHTVGEFVDKVRQEIASSEIEKEKRTGESKLVNVEQPDKSLVEYSSGVSHSEDSGSKRSGTKGPSDEMWKVDEAPVQDPSGAEAQEDGDRAGNMVVKRTGRSLWNIIGDIVRLRWSPRSESQSTGRRTAGRNSPNQSTSSETWFSGHEAEESEDASRENGKKSSEQEPLFGGEEARSQFKEGSVSSTLQGHLKQVGTSAPPSAAPSEISSGTSSISLPLKKETSPSTSGDASSFAVIVESSISLPAIRLLRSPIIRSASEKGDENIYEGSVTEQPNNAMNQSESAVNEGEQTRKKLHRKDQVSRDRFDEWEEAYRVETEQRKIDEMFMREALLEARKAADSWEVPVGAVLVHNGKIIARGCNLVEELRDSTAHAEMICIREASNTLRTWRLSETTLYVTLEPCPMCAGAILQARIDTVVWGAPNKLLGADGSWIRLFPNGAGGNDLEQNDKPAAPVHPFHPKIIVRRGVLASECADAMQQFFQLRRKKKEKKTESPPGPSCLPIVHHHPSKFLTKMHDAFHIMFCL